GNLDPAAAVGLARQLVGKPAAEVNRILDEQQAARDAGILATMVHPLRTTAWAKEKVTGSGGMNAHQITVEPGTGRLKVTNAGLSLPFVPDPAHAVVVRDAAGKEVGRCRVYGERGPTGPRLRARSGSSMAERSPTATMVNAPGPKRRRATAATSAAVMPASRAGRVR